MADDVEVGVFQRLHQFEGGGLVDKAGECGADGAVVQYQPGFVVPFVVDEESTEAAGLYVVEFPADRAVAQEQFVPVNGPRAEQLVDGVQFFVGKRTEETEQIL